MRTITKEHKNDNRKDTVEVIVRFDATDILRAIDLGLRNNPRRFTYAPWTVVEILTEELLGTFYETGPGDQCKETALIEDILGTQYRVIAGLLSVQLERALKDVTDEFSVLGCSSVRVTRTGLSDFALYVEDDYACYVRDS
jgi:hypothetical protein